MDSTNQRPTPETLLKSVAHTFTAPPPIFIQWINTLVPREPIVAKYPDMATVFVMFDAALARYQERRSDTEMYEFVLDRSEAVAFYHAIEDVNDALLTESNPSIS